MGIKAVEQSQAQQNQDRGREASRPSEIPTKGWKDVLWRAWKQSGEDNMGIIAGGVTYAVLLALFPGLAALVSVYGLISDPAEIQQQMNSMSGLLPAEAQKLIGDELQQLTSHSSGTLGIGVVVGLLIALWSASRGVSALITALNIAYGEKETRGFFKFNLLALALTIGLIIAGLIAIGLVAGVPAVLSLIGVGQTTRWLFLVLEWPVLSAFIMLLLAVLYRLAPNRDAPQWRWISPGAVAATLVWIIASILFTVYVANFNSYDKTYGSVGGIIILLTWLYISAYVVLLGAEINAEAERQTRKDTTVGSPQAMGERRARAADTLGPSYDEAH
jgi:membrane protein